MLFDFQCDSCGKARQIRFEGESFTQAIPCDCGGSLCRGGPSAFQPPPTDPQINGEIKFRPQTKAEAAELQKGNARGIL